VAKARVSTASAGLDDLLAGSIDLGGSRLVTARIDVGSADELKSIGDALRAKLGSGVGLLAAVVEGKVQLVCVVTDDLVASKKAEAGKIVGAVAKILGGGGGGRPHMATAGGKDAAKLDEALRETKTIVASYLHPREK